MYKCWSLVFDLVGEVGDVDFRRVVTCTVERIHPSLSRLILQMQLNQEMVAKARASRMYAWCSRAENSGRNAAMNHLS